MSARWHLFAFVAIESVVVLADVLIGGRVMLGVAYVVGVLVYALRGSPRGVAAASLLTLSVFMLSSGLHGTLGATGHLVRMVIVTGLAAVALSFAVARTRLHGDLERQRRLSAENARLLADLRRKETELSAVLAGIADAVLVHGADLRPLYANQAAADVLGLPTPADILAADPSQIPSRFRFTGEDGRAIEPDELPGRRIFAGERHPDDLVLRSVDTSTGRELWTVTKATAVLGADGQPALAVNVIHDITDARRQAQSATLLARAGEVLGESLNLSETLERVAWLAVGPLADWCSVDLVDGGQVRTVAVAHHDPDKLQAGHALLDRHPVRIDERYGLGTIVRGARRFVRNDITPDDLRRYARDAEHLHELESLGMRHVAVVGIQVGDQTLGALTLIRGRSGTPFSQDEVSLVEELARRASTAVLNASLYEERAEVAHTLQQSLLPPSLPEIEGLQMAVHYRPVGQASEVGGDFYDAFPVPDGWLVAMGDVTGKGAAAAALTGLARAALESVATLTGRPGLALEHLDRLLARRGDMALTSVAALHIRSDELPPRVSVYGAGHPPALLIRRGEVSALLAPGPLLGAFADQSWAPLEVRLEAGDVVVLRTDGVTDAVGVDGRLGEDAVRRALTGLPAGGADAAVDRVRRLVEQHQAGVARDDVAVLALAVDGRPIVAGEPAGNPAAGSLAHVVTLEAAPESVRVARELVTSYLEGILDEVTVGSVRLLVSELASNAVRHAAGEPYRLQLDLDPHRLRVEVIDTGPGPGSATTRAALARERLPGGGYGLAIVDRLSTRWGIERTGESAPTRVWFEIKR